MDRTLMNGQKLNYRERVECVVCGLNERQRMILASALRWSRLSRSRHIYIQEFITLFFQVFDKIVLREFKSCCDLTGSEFLGWDKTSGNIYDNVRHEDVCRTSFMSGSVDLIISNDVYEHVPDIQAAFQEAYRILSDRGAMIFSVPFIFGEAQTKKRARLGISKEIEFLEKPIYHDDPLNPDGALVFHDFGWDMLQQLKEAGFSDVFMLDGHDPTLGYFGGICPFFVAQK